MEVGVKNKVVGIFQIQLLLLIKPNVYGLHGQVLDGARKFNAGFGILGMVIIKLIVKITIIHFHVLGQISQEVLRELMDGVLKTLGILVVQILQQKELVWIHFIVGGSM
jgi:hypothetical protein